MVNTSILKKRMSGAGLARDLLHHSESMGALNLVAVSLAAALVDGGSFVPFRGGFVAASLHVILHPIDEREGGRRG